MTDKKEKKEEWDPEIPHINEQLHLVSQRMLARMRDLDITPRIIQSRSGLALNSVKTALMGKTCNVGTLAAVCAAMKWSLFDAFKVTLNVQDEEKKDVTIQAQPIVSSPTAPASSILD